MASSPIDTRIRAVIIHEEKILLMRLTGSTYFCLPGGGWVAPESSKECLKREVFEELGVQWHVGWIAGVNEYRYKNNPCNELWYFITNVKDFLDTEKLGWTHTHEFEEIHWFDLEIDTVAIQPENLRDAYIFWKQNWPQFFSTLIS